MTVSDPGCVKIFGDCYHGTSVKFPKTPIDADQDVLADLIRAQRRINRIADKPSKSGVSRGWRKKSSQNSEILFDCAALEDYQENINF